MLHGMITHIVGAVNRQPTEQALWCVRAGGIKYNKSFN